MVRYRSIGGKVHLRRWHLNRLTLHQVEYQASQDLWHVSQRAIAQRMWLGPDEHSELTLWIFWFDNEVQGVTHSHLGQPNCVRISVARIVDEQVHGEGTYFIGARQ